MASNSPRRRQLLADAGFHFEPVRCETDESFPATMEVEEVPVFLARKKAESVVTRSASELVLCADTVVIVGDRILNKPANADEAASMLTALSGRTHRVVTGICLAGPEGIRADSDTAEVTFCELEPWEIAYYVAHYQPLDKAGAYGIQEWIGMIGVSRIQGSFYTIMGLPLHKVYRLLKPYLVRSDTGPLMT